MAEPIDIGGGQWKLRVFVNEVDGRKVRYRRQVTFKADGIRRARTIARQKEAEVRAELTAKHQGTTTVRRAAEDWWEFWLTLPRSPTTRNGYRTLLDNHILEAPFVDRPVGEVTTGEISRWYTALATSGRKQASGGLTPQTVQRVHNVLSQIFDQAVSDRLLDRNPATLARKPEARPKTKTLVPIGTLEALLAAAHRKHPARARLLAFAALTGLRRGELCGLRWSHVGIGTGTLAVEVNVVRAKQRFVDPRSGSDDWVLHKKDPKAHQKLSIALDRQAAAIAAQQAEWQQTFGVVDGGDPFLWSLDPPFVEPTNPQVMTDWFRRSAKDAGVVGFTLHDLRHWQGSQMLATGATLQDVKERLRHRSLDSTMGYLHSDYTRQQGFLELLPQLELPGGDSSAEGVD